METISQFMNAVVEWTMFIICTGIMLICITGVWKWFIGIMVRALHCLFPEIPKKKNRRRDPQGSDGQ